MNPSYKRKRNREILFNYESGKSVKDLMRIHQISIPRVYQIINKEKKRLEEELRSDRGLPWEVNQLLERLSGLNTLLGELDDVLEIIRSSGFRYEARDRLMDRYGLNMKQVVAFLDMNIGKLTGMEQERIRVEYLTEEEEK